jgi:deoxyribodipyrimidine photo-lyase
MTKQFKTGLVWFRRDLRMQDNRALHAALQACESVHCAFVFDHDILSPLPRQDRRVEFIRESLVSLDHALRDAAGDAHCGLLVEHGTAMACIERLVAETQAQAVFCAHDYEPSAQTRDAQVDMLLQDRGVAFITVKDHVIFEGRELLTQGAKPYSVFTPYKKAWLARLTPSDFSPSNIPQRTDQLSPRPLRYRTTIPSLQELGFEPSNLAQLSLPTGAEGGQTLLLDFLSRIDRYDQTRDFPSIKGPSYLSVHLRFGTVSIRQLVARAYERALDGNAGASVWLGELIWRDFYFQILANFPHVAASAFKPAYDRIVWEEGPHADQLFAAWCAGQTGYPLVDAAMAQLNQTGYMHNRLRMVAGSFLVKHLGIHWQRGEQYFAQTLNDFDLAANNGGWQWVSSSGCDAQPYFRIFNPMSQSERFDADGKFIKRYLPQLGSLDAKAIHAPWKASSELLARHGVRLGDNYPHPIVDHAQGRALTLERYACTKDKI